MSTLKAYYTVAKNTWDEATNYRLNFSVWRLRNLLQLVTTYFLWATIIPIGSTFGNYTQSSILTYILGSSFLSAFVLSTRTAAVADEIVTGELSNYLVKPVNYFLYYFSKDIGDKAMNIFFSFFEVSIVIYFLHPPLFLQTNIVLLSLFFLSVIFSIILYYFFSMSLSFIGFWSSEVWAPRFIFFLLLTFFAGGFFPLNILPQPLFLILSALPFPYLLYLPMQIYLGKVSSIQLAVGLSVSFVWIFLLYYFTHLMWKKGLRLFGAEGR